MMRVAVKMVGMMVVMTVMVDDDGTLGDGVVVIDWGVLDGNVWHHGGWWTVSASSSPLVPSPPSSSSVLVYLRISVTTCLV